MSFKVGDPVRARIAISHQWFHAWLNEIHEDYYIVETFFPISDQSFWRVEKKNVAPFTHRGPLPVKQSESLQGSLNSTIKTIKGKLK